MGQDIMLASLLAVAAGFGTLAAYAFFQARRERSVRKAVIVAAHGAGSDPRL